MLTGGNARFFLKDFKENLYSQKWKTSDVKNAFENKKKFFFERLYWGYYRHL